MKKNIQTALLWIWVPTAMAAYLLQFKPLAASILSVLRGP